MTWRGSFREDPRNAIEPHVAVSYTHEDWLASRDPALALIESLEEWANPDLAASSELPRGSWLVDEQLVARVSHRDGGLWLSIDDGSA